MKTILIIIICILSLNTLQAQWEPMDGPFGGRISDLAKNDSHQFAATKDGLFRSSNGNTWSKIQIIPGRHIACSYVDVYDSLVVVSTSELIPHLFLSKTNGDTWIEISRPKVKHLFGLYLTDFGVYAHYYDQLWFSGDEGQSWHISSFPIAIASIFDVSTDHHQMFIGSTGGIYTSSFTNDEWSFIDCPFPQAQIQHVYVEGSLILAVAPSNELLLRSSDAGESWTWNEDERLHEDWYKNIMKLGSTYFLSLSSNILKSTDQGLTWTECGSRSYQTATDFITLDSFLLIATLYHGVMRSDDQGESFYVATQGITASNVECVTMKDQTLIAASNYAGIFDFDENENKWLSQYDDTLFSSYFNDMLVFNSSLYVTHDSRHLYRYTDPDQSWTDISDVNSTGWYYDLDTFGGNLLVEHNGLQIWNPDDHSWTEFFILVAGDTIKPQIFAQHQDYLYASEEDRLFRQNVTNGIWEKILNADTIQGVLYYHLVGVYPIEDAIFIIMDYYQDSHRYRILKSDDQGETWQYADEGFPEIVYPWWSGFDQMQQIGSFAVVNARNYSFGVVISALDDVHWFPFNEGLPSLNVNDITFDEEYMYAATSSNGVWRRKISDLNIVSIHPILQTNEISIFPNPSNGNFTLKANSDLSGEARLLIYDLNGRICLSREINLNPITEMETSILTNGLYFLSLQTGEKFYTAKLLLQK